MGGGGGGTHAANCSCSSFCRSLKTWCWYLIKEQTEMGGQGAQMPGFSERGGNWGVTAGWLGARMPGLTHRSSWALAWLTRAASAAFSCTHRASRAATCSCATPSAALSASASSARLDSAARARAQRPALRRR